MKKLIESQNKAIRKYLEKGKKLTALDALYLFGCFRLSARIFDLREMGLGIKAERISVSSPSVYNGVKYLTRYSLTNGRKTKNRK